MHITRLRLVGFKSFTEPTELLIEQGLTGVVGPNGCGKSNLLEALRWVMGETSHKSMRAAAMDDVIFAGTATRPARNTAEVTIVIDNRARRAPAEYNGHDAVEVTRRIEREAGSAYRINGREARARDVRILFEDAATGARSPALVRQGQIGEIVNARPDQRRRVLEDAAGVAGLHSRRHEAELRLEAAEANLARLSDLLGQLGSQIDGLKRQVRQARRYKDLAGEIRGAEAILLYLQWAQAQTEVAAAERSLAEAHARLLDASTLEARLLREEAEVAESLQPLREAEAERAAAAARLRNECDSLEREAERASQRQRELEARAAQLEADAAREHALAEEAGQMLGQLSGQRAEDEAALAAATGSEAAAGAALRSAELALAAIEERLLAATARVMELRAGKQGLEAGLAEQQQQAAALERQLAAIDAQMREAAGRAPEAEKLAAAAALEQRLARELTSLEKRLAEAEEQARAAGTDASAKREASRAAELALTRLAAEAATAAKLLGSPADAAGSPVVDELRVARGYETALGAALGDDLEASTDPAAPLHWRHLPPAAPDAPLPEGAEPLADHVVGPPALVRRLRQIGIVARDRGPVLQPALAPGQRLVSRAGDLWRWDGLTAAAEAPNAAAQRLAERNRLEELRRLETTARTAAEQAAAAAGTAADRLLRRQEEERRLRQSWREVQNRLAETRKALSSIEKAAREAESRLATLAEARERAAEGLVEMRSRIAETTAALAALGDAGEADGALAAARTETAAERGRVADLRAALAEARRDLAERRERIAAVAAEIAAWSRRGAGSADQMERLATRLAEARAELGELAAGAPGIEKRRTALMAEAAAAEAARQAAQDRLAAASAAHREAAKVLREGQAAVASAREDRGRSEARLDGARQRRSQEVARIRDRLDVAPDGCLAVAQVRPGAALPELAEVERRLARLQADRERLGAVNLQAEEELAAVQARYENMEGERRDIAAAIAKLRGGIGQLNREARKRLQQAFDDVNGHFQRLFITLFGGGEARLEMVESEDPLESGLEIVARPPGKKPATLSLLSGGEQTLTALSLIFAVFLTNPSPICVLDEVDAPLDDANVDRFCNLMDRMAEDTETRFLVITHHPMTMSRMDRLFGVTMAEKGVSQLVSVDLATAERFVEARTG